VIESAVSSISAFWGKILINVDFTSKTLYSKPKKRTKASYKVDTICY